MQLFSPHTGILFWTIVAIPAILFLLVALINLIRSDFIHSNNKLLWTFIIIMVPLFGPLFYFVIGRPQNTREK